MRLKFKPSFFVAMIVSLGMWYLIVSFVSAEVAPVTGQTSISQVTNFFSQNWTAILLVCSEFTALLPGPWNGIIQSILRALNKKARRNNSNH